VDERLPEKSDALYVDSEDDWWFGFVLGFSPAHRKRPVGVAMAYKDGEHGVRMDGLPCTHWMPLPGEPE
jgi:hypothetical protein